MREKVAVTISASEDNVLLDDWVDRWGVHEKGYFWAERDHQGEVRLCIIPMSSIERADIVIPEELVKRGEKNVV